MWAQLGLILLIIAAFGFSYQCVIFVRKTLPENYGNNPGFGCFESMVMPWFITSCFGAGLLMQSWIWGVITFGIGFFCLGFLAMLLAHLFGARLK